MNYLFAIIAGTGFFTAGLSAVFVLTRNPQLLLNRLFFLYTAIIAFFNLAHFLTLITNFADRSEIYFKIAITLWYCFIAILLHFILVLTKMKALLRKPFFYFLIYLPVPIISLVNWRTNWFYAGMQMTHWGFSEVFGSYYWVSVLYSTIFLLVGIYFLLQGWRQSKKERLRRQAALVLTGLFCAFVVGFIAEVILPLWGWRLVNVVPACTLFYILFFTIAMLKYGILILTPSSMAVDIVSTMPDILMFIDDKERVRIINQKFIKSLDFTQNEMIDKPAKLVLKEGIHEKILQGNSISSYNTELIKKDGSILPVSLDATLVKDQLGDEIGCVMVFHDISNEKKMLLEQEKAIKELTRTKEQMLDILKETTDARNEARKKSEEIEKLYRDLKVVDRMKTEFLSVISHELRTPITPIKGYVRMLLAGKMGELNPSQVKALEIINRQGIHLEQLIESVIDVSRATHKKIQEINKEPVSISGLLTELIEVMQPQWQEKEIKISNELPQKFPVVLADAGKLRRLFTSLLGNAIKFVPQNGAIVIKGFETDGRVQIEVADNGIGIARENLEKIFENFFQVDSSYTRSAGGVGLGLGIARDIVKAHGGEIWAQSEGVGKGAQFCFTLPIG